MTGHRRTALWRGFGAVLFALCATGAARASDAGSMTILSLGGSYQESLSEYWFKPFEQESGIRIDEAAGYHFAQLKEAIESGNAEADLVDVGTDSAKALNDAGLLERIDWDQIPESCISGIPADMRLDYAFPTIQWAMVMAYNTDKFSEGEAPRSWADFWDTQAFPGKRGSIGATRPPTEMAALAMNGDISRLYPFDISAAFDKIRELGGDLVFADHYAQVAQNLADGEVDMIVIPNGRIVPLVKAGKPVAINWNQHLRYSNFFAIPKGARNKDSAMKFLAWVCQPEILARIAEHTNYGPINTDAYKSIEPETARLLPGNPATAGLGRAADAAWLAEHRHAIHREWEKLSVK